MDAIYEYKFVRLGDYRGSAWFGVSDKVRNAYEDVVHEQARDGWRLVQIFAPGVATFGAAKYYELIFERERTEDTIAPPRRQQRACRSSSRTMRWRQAVPPTTATVLACAVERRPMRDGPHQPISDQRRRR